MSEQLLEAFREDAEQHARVPAFETIQAAGRRRRLRRHAVVGAMTACILGVSGIVAGTSGDSTDPQPAEDPDETSLTTPYPVMTNTTLEAGAYEFRPSKDTSLPAVRFTLPAGWNSWLGPNRFAGLDDLTTDEGRTNGKLLVQDPEWVLGMVALDVKWIAQRGCTMTDLTGEDTTSLVEALTAVPRLTVTSGPESTVRFGHPAVHLQMREQGTGDACPQDSLMTTAEAAVRYLGRGTTIDAWVVDVDGRPLLLMAVWTARTPSAEVQDLLGIVDSIELVEPR
ncbi:hypothetical protein [Nocardioides astragali]|uniref:Uncharacterized protein n=1 Tax=Nocardioides astragali TaxID=1776736 RepID=A0ABW2N0U7_9ACTN|nr:hypothetical protein [Nocardioides astragali]